MEKSYHEYLASMNKEELIIMLRVTRSTIAESTDQEENKRLTADIEFITTLLDRIYNPLNLKPGDKVKVKGEPDIYTVKEINGSRSFIEAHIPDFTINPVCLEYVSNLEAV